MSRRLTIDDLYELALPEQAALSPDATSCAYVLCEQDADEDKSVRSIWCVSVADRQPRRLTRRELVYYIFHHPSPEVIVLRKQLSY